MEANREASPPPLASANIPLHLRTHGAGSEETFEPQRVKQGVLQPNSHGAKTKPSVAADELRCLPAIHSLGGRLSSVLLGSYMALPGPAPASPPSSPLIRFCVRNKPSMLVALSQLFAALMNLSARLLELEGEGMHPVQVLLLRQGLTVMGCCSYMCWKCIPDFPFGKREVRWLLVGRGLSGFFGIYGMWYSMMYLPLADATVITFLAPGMAGLICYFVLREPFTRLEKVATAVALLGVVLIAQPTALFFKSAHNPTAEPPEQTDGSLRGLEPEPTAEERLIAVGMALLGVMGAAGAFTTLRTIAQRADPLISVNFFGMACTVICLVALVLAPALEIDQPHLKWVTPTSVNEWLLLFSSGISGFIMQYLLTSGLAADKSNRANSMVYTHMLFAVSFDRWVFGHSMGVMSFLGCALILGSAITVVLTKKPPGPKADDVERQGNVAGEEEGSSMLIAVGRDADELSLGRAR